MLGRFGLHSSQVWLLEDLYAPPDVRLPNHAIVAHNIKLVQQYIRQVNPRLSGTVTRNSNYGQMAILLSSETIRMAGKRWRWTGIG